VRDFRIEESLKQIADIVLSWRYHFCSLDKLERNLFGFWWEGDVDVLIVFSPKPQP